MICIDQGDDEGVFVWCRLNETYKHVRRRKTGKFYESFRIWGCMLFKRSGKMEIIPSITSTHVYTEILDNFLIPLIENWFGDDKVIFHWAEEIKAFLQERHIKSMPWPANSPDLKALST